MNNIFEIMYTEEILKRTENLTENSQPKWGKMSVGQMLAHCSSFQDIAMGYFSPRRSLLGILVGRFAKSIFFNEKPLAHNMSTIPTILITDKRDFEIEREKLKKKIKTFFKKTERILVQFIHTLFSENSPPNSGGKESTSI